ncbi:uncharacterized protein K444DRAFT_528351, partial [Hyaloscypha bicolor E]
MALKYRRPVSVILVMGMTGAGKSSFIQHLTDCDVKIGHGMLPCERTSEIGFYSLTLGNRAVTLVDTPSFDDKNRSDLEILQEIIYFLGLIYSSTSVKLAGIIYLQRMTGLGIQSSARRCQNIIEALCGKSALSHLVLATTMFESENPWEEERIVRRWFQYHWGFSLKSVAAVYRHDDTKKSAWRILNYILSLQGGMVLEIQREMIDQRKTLDQTFIGQQLLK